MVLMNYAITGISKFLILKFRTRPRAQPDYDSRFYIHHSFLSITFQTKTPGTKSSNVSTFFQIPEKKKHNFDVDM